MIPKQETREPIEERGTGSAKDARLSGRDSGRHRVIQVLLLVVIALMLAIYAFYETKWILGTPIWVGFWAFPIFLGVWLIVAIARVLRKR